jgi:DtxR family Mn-dependent transcriptional regulator
MKKFVDKNWVIYETYKPIKVTELGRKEAAIVVRKHRLTEKILVKGIEPYYMQFLLFHYLNI